MLIVRMFVRMDNCNILLNSLLKMLSLLEKIVLESFLRLF